MHCNDLKLFKDKLLCCFCRNPLTHVDITIKDYKGDFVSVWCPSCKDLGKQWGPKFVVCCCSSEPKELDIEMARLEIATAFTEKQIQNDKEAWKDLPNIKLVNQDKGSDKTEEYVSKVPKKHKRSVSTGF